MSVNEVKLKKVEKDKKFEVKGTGPGTNRTFAIGNEDHTIGNSLRHILIHNSKVEFAGYSVPHPSEPIVHIRVQTTGSTTSLKAVKESCETLNEQCEYVLSKLEAALPEIKDDSEKIQLKLAELNAMDEDEYDDEEEI